MSCWPPRADQVSTAGRRRVNYPTWQLAVRPRGTPPTAAGQLHCLDAASGYRASLISTSTSPLARSSKAEGREADKTSRILALEVLPQVIQSSLGGAP